MIQQHKISRRPVLQGLGGITLGLPSLNCFANPKNTNHTPMRMVCIGIGLGFAPQLFFPTDVGGNYRNSSYLKPLNPLKHKFSVFSNLDHGTEARGGHGGVHAFLSGVLSSNANHLKEKNISIDQKAAQSIGSSTRYPSLQFSPDSNSNNRISWARSGVSRTPTNDLEVIFNSLFEAHTQDKVNAIKKTHQEKKSIIDLVRIDATHLKRKVGKDDQEKLDQYFTTLRDLEKQIIQHSNWIDKPKPKVKYQIKSGINELDYIERVPFFYDLMALALQTDSTRIITLELSSIGKNLGGFNITKGHHQLTHHGKVESYLNELSIIETYHTAQFFNFIQKLDQIQESNGKSLLDNTMALLGSGMGNASSHSNKNLPLILAGGGFKHGQHLSYQQKNGSNTLANKLYVTMLQRFGVETDTFNNVSGTLTGLETV